MTSVGLAPNGKIDLVHFKTCLFNDGGNPMMPQCTDIVHTTCFTGYTDGILFLINFLYFILFFEHDFILRIGSAK